MSGPNPNPYQNQGGSAGWQPGPATQQGPPSGAIPWGSPSGTGPGGPPTGAGPTGAGPWATPTGAAPGGPPTGAAPGGPPTGAGPGGPPTGSGSWGPPTQQPPQPGVWNVPPPPPRGRRPWIPVAAIGGVAAIGLLVWLIVSVSSDGSSGSGDPADYGLAAAQRESAPEVSQLTADAIAAAEELDVEAGLDLLCQAPSSKELGNLNEAIADGRAEAGGQDPELSFTITEVEQGGGAGSATVRVDGEGNIDGAFLEVELTMTQGSDDGYCIDKVTVVDGGRAD